MIKRIVKMTFQVHEVDNFLSLFDAVKDKIRNYPGCHHLELLRDVSESNSFFTFSYWDSEEHLNHYRHSDLFKATWKKTKAMFSAKPQAWTVVEHYNSKLSGRTEQNS